MTAIVRYVDTASSAGGNGTTQSHSGANRAYASLSEWEAAEQQNLTDSGGDTMTVYCAGTTMDTTCTIAGWTTSATNNITVAGDPAAPDGDGKNTGNTFSTSFYRIRTNGASVAGLQNSGFGIGFLYTEIIDLQFVQDAGVAIYCLLADNNATVVNARRCRFRSTSADATPLGAGNLPGLIENCTFEWAGSGNASSIYYTAAFTVTVTNCTIEGGTFGIIAGGGTLTVKNCAVFNNSDDVFAYGTSTISITYSIGDDADFDSGTGNIGMNDTAGAWNANWVDYTTGDYRVKDASASIYNAGNNGGTTPATDIIGTTRPQSTTVDIGAWELIVVAAPAGNPMRGLGLPGFRYR